MSRARTASRTSAALAIVVLVACNLLALHHQAEVRHVVDTRGAAVHAQTIACHGEGQTHAHRLPAPRDRDLDICDVLAFTHAFAIAPLATAPVVAPAPRASDRFAARVPRTDLVASLLHVAPKTSPPRG